MTVFEANLARVDRGQVTRAELVEFLHGRTRVWARVAIDRPVGGIARVIRLEVTTDAEPPGFETVDWDYQTVRFISSVLTGPVVAEWIEYGINDGDGSSVEVSIAESGTWERFPSHAGGERPALAWPYWRAQFSIGATSNEPTDRTGFLVGRDAPSFPNYDMAAETFFCRTPISSPPLGYSGHPLTVRVTDTRARLERIRFDPVGVDVTIDGTHVRGTRVEFVSAAGPHAAVIDAAGAVRFELADGVPDTWWTVVSRDGRWLDYRHTAPFAPPVPGVELPAVLLDPDDELHALMATGEGPHTEYKRQLPDRTATANAKVARTVAAFANGTGGVILFGIDRDEITVVGLPEPFPDVRDRLTNLVNDNLVPRPHIDIRPYPTSHGLLVVGLHVTPGDQPPYGIHPGNPQYYLRRGASTLPARPDEIATLIRARTDTSRDPATWRP